jgi:hypothetical protein
MPNLSIVESVCIQCGPLLEIKMTDFGKYVPYVVALKRTLQVLLTLTPCMAAKMMCVQVDQQQILDAFSFEWF